MPEPTSPPPLIAGSGRSAYKSEAGYTFDVDYAVQVDGQAVVTTASEPVGYAQVALPVSGSGTITNTTQGHDAPPEELPWLRVIGVYPKAAAVCTHADSDTDAPYGGNPVNANPAVVTIDGRYCAVFFVAGGSARRPLTAGENAPLDLTPNGSSALPDGSGAVAPGRLVLNHVPERQARGIGSSLTAPPKYWALVALRPDCPGSGFDPHGYGIIASEPAGFRACIS